MKRKFIIPALLSSVITVSSLLSCVVTISACQDSNTNLATKQNASSILGAIGGGIMGSNIGKGKGRIVGASVGAIVGYNFGRWMGENLDTKNQQNHIRTTYQSLEKAKTGETVEWRDPDSGARGMVTPTRTFKKAGKHCREYNQTIIVGGKKQTAVGTACRNENGTWVISE